MLLDEAERTPREGSVDDLSLRDLARRADVSHGAPRSHFVDRQALLDAVAERGFERLAEEVAVAGAATLLDLISSTKSTDPPEHVRLAAGRLFGTFDALFDEDLRAGRFTTPDPDRTKLLFVALLQGVASLITTRRVSEAQGAALVDDAVGLLLPGAGRRGDS